MTIREFIEQLDQIAIEYETELDQKLRIDFDPNDGGYYALTGVEIVRSLKTKNFRLIVTEE